MMHYVQFIYSNVHNSSVLHLGGSVHGLNECSHSKNEEGITEARRRGFWVGEGEMWGVVGLGERRDWKRKPPPYPKPFPGPVDLILVCFNDLTGTDLRLFLLGRLGLYLV